MQFTTPPRAFVQSFAQANRNELKDTRNTTALLPGPTGTNFFERANLQHTKVGAGEKVDPTEVAKDGFEGLMAGKDHVIAGSFKNTFRQRPPTCYPIRCSRSSTRGTAEP